MRRSILLSLWLVSGLLFLVAAPSEAHGHGRVVIGVGPAWWGPYWWYPPPYYYPPPPAVVVQQDPPVYVQQPAPPAPAAPAEWYYCASAKGYYPTVPSCPEPWVRVPATP